MNSIEAFTKEKNENIRTITTLEIAEMMDISHRDILNKLQGTSDRDGNIKQIGIIPTLAKANFRLSDYFIESTYKDASGKSNKCYNVTKLGCDFLANKFTGEKGILFTAKYVKRFNEMEEELKPKSTAELLLMYAQQFYEQEQRMNTIESKLKEVEAKITTHNEDYYTVAGYASLRGLNVDISKANMLGRKASKLSRKYGYDIGKAQDVRFGEVNTYHVDILKDVFQEVS
ncbi:MAG: Rha family transcriptional regulator [Ruminococcus flavefaciens]|nr:Rha family transcriptional regulator [Ruminococcus flavefaciens]